MLQTLLRQRNRSDVNRGACVNPFKLIWLSLFAAKGIRWLRIWCESVRMFSQTGNFLQARSAVALGEDISSADRRERGSSMEKTLMAHVPGQPSTAKLGQHL